MINKGADQIAQMRKLVCFFCCSHATIPGLLVTGRINTAGLFQHTRNREKAGKNISPNGDGSSGGFPLNISPLPTMQNRSKISSPS